MCIMFTRSRLPLFVVALLLLATTGLVAQQGADTGDRERRIAFFGSSVPNGTGDETGHGGYTGRMRTLLEPRGWEVLNRSRGGDNTVTIAPRFEPEGAPDPDTRYLTTVDPGYAVLALSLGNEGIMECAPGETRRCTATKDEADRIYEQHANGLWTLVERTRAKGIVPIVTLCYTRGDFNEREYTCTRRMNLLINSWDVPSVNLLGIVLSHYVARGETLLFVDGELAGSVAERLQPDRFVLGGAGVAGIAAPDQVDYKDWMIHRAGLNPDEARALHAGTLLQASLEVYAPLRESAGAAGGAVENLAQSLSVVEVDTAGVTHSQN